MPVVEIKQQLLEQRLGKTYSVKEFGDLCFDFGIELDEVTSEFEKVSREKGREVAESTDADKEPLYKIEVPANRYDLLCTEGLTRALRIFEKRETLPDFQAITPDSPMVMKVTTNCAKVRPFVVCAVLRNIELDSVSLASFIALQDKLHFNICRKRSLVAIGTHDLDTIQPPFVYDAREPQAIRFQALKEESEMNAEELFNEYRKRGQSQCSVLEYLPLIEEQPRYPVIVDSNGVVLSLPPIINGEHSKMKESTRNVLVECTATDLTKARVVLNTVVTCFAEYCQGSSQFTVEKVRVEYETDCEASSDAALIAAEDGADSAKVVGTSYLTPEFDSPPFHISVEYINRLLGTDLSKDQIREFLLQMGLHVRDYSSENDSGVEFKIASDDKVAMDLGSSSDEAKEASDVQATLVVTSPPTRADILHSVDIAEDVAIAFGYNRIQRQLPQSSTIGMEQPLNSLSDKIRLCVSQTGFNEVLNWCLTSKRDSFELMRLSDDLNIQASAIQIGNPKTKDFEICRINLLPGVLRTLSHNIGKTPLPLKLFEVSDVVFYDSRFETNARNERRLCVLMCSNKESGFEVIHSVLDRVMQQNSFEFVSFAKMQSEFGMSEDSELFKKSSEIVPDSKVVLKKDSKGRKMYALSESDRPSFFPRRQATIWINGYKAGCFGIVHPIVVNNFGIWSVTKCMVSALELNIEPFL